MMRHAGGRETRDTGVLSSLCHSELELRGLLHQGSFALTSSSTGGFTQSVWLIWIFEVRGKWYRQREAVRAGEW